MQPDLFSFDNTKPDLPWRSLQEILRCWLDMIEVKKVVAGDFKAGDPVRPFGMAEVQHPWKLVSFSEKILQRTLVAWDGLLRAIEGRMPPIDDEGKRPTPETLFPRNSFVRSLLNRARRPRSGLKRIAPSVSIPATETITAHQPFKDLAKQYRHATPTHGLDIAMADDEDPLYPPYLLFPVTTNNGERIETSLPSDPAVEKTFEWPFDSLQTLPGGLYIETCCPWNESSYEDAWLLILPFPVGKPDSKTELHQTKINPFVPGHRTQLCLILESWREMVERGDWKVDEKGVKGGVERWREVDGSGDVAGRSTVRLHW